MANRTRDEYQANKMVQQNKEVSHFYRELFITKKMPDKEYLQNGDIKPKYKNLWFMKKSTGENHRSAALEVIAQELLRFIIPSHPETRIVFSDDKENSYVTSRQVPFETLAKFTPEEIYSRCKTGEWKGMGGILMVEVWLDNRDFRIIHLGRNNNDEIIKAEGDRRFSALQDIVDNSVDYDLSLLGLNQLPLLPGLYAYNWLDVVRNGKITAKPDSPLDTGAAAAKELRRSESFHCEMNLALLRIVLLPDALLTKFVRSYLLASETLANEIIHELARRRDDLLEAAYKNQSFCQYMQSKAAQNDFDVLIKSIGSFTTVNQKHLLPEKDYMKIQDAMNTKFERVRSKASAEPNRISPKARKEMTAIMNEYVTSMAGFKSLNEKRLGWAVAKSKNAEHAKERVDAMSNLAMMVEKKSSELGFNECEDALADMMLAEAKIHQDSKYGEVFLEAGKYSHCIHAVKTILEADRSRQLQMNQTRAAPAA